MAHVRRAMIDILFAESRGLFLGSQNHLERRWTQDDYLEMLREIGLTPIIVEIGHDVDSEVALQGNILLIRVHTELSLINKSRQITDGPEITERILEICADKIHKNMYGETSIVNPDMRIFIVLRSKLKIVLEGLLKSYLRAHEIIRTKTPEMVRKIVKERPALLASEDNLVRKIIDVYTEKRSDRLSSFVMLSYNMEELRYIMELFEKECSTSLP